MLKINNNQLFAQTNNLIKNLNLNNFSTTINSFKQEEKKIKKENVSKTSEEEKKMFCFQCEQTFGGTGCTISGICGKTPNVAALQDAVYYQTKVASYVMLPILKDAKLLSENVELVEKTKNLILNSIYGTLTNVNFDSKRFVDWISDISKCIEELQKISNVGIEKINFFKGIAEENSLLNKGKEIGIISRINSLVKNNNTPLEDARVIVHLQELLSYGIKGFVAYYTEALMNNNFESQKRNLEIENFLFESLAGIVDEKNNDYWNVDGLVGKCLECGKANFLASQELDTSNNLKYGHPEPSQVKISKPEKGKCILVTGHNLKDLKRILERAEEEKDIFVYTHGEMLPASGYPGLKKFKSFKGHFGGAWQKQKQEFKFFPGPIVITTNCVMPPTNDYKDRIFTTNVTGLPNAKHIDLFKDEDLEKLFAYAKKCEGFNKKNIKNLANNLKLELTKKEKKTGKIINVGFGHHNVLEKFGGPIIQAIKDGDIKHFFLIGGCDGTEKSRSVFTDYAINTPKDTIILGIGCGKYRYNYLDLGEIKAKTGAIFPRVLDVGQCNDSYGAIKIALGLKEAFGLKDVNELPLTLIVSWFEQKAVAVLLTLLYLGIKNVRLGPNLPAFIPPSVLQVLVEKFNIIPINDKTDVKKDLQNILKKKE